MSTQRKNVSAELDKLSSVDWERGYDAYKEGGKTVTSVRKALHVGFFVARALVQEGYPPRGWPAYETRWREEDEREQKIKLAVASARDDERLEFLRFHEMYRHLRDSASTFFRTGGEQGVEPKKNVVQGLLDLMALSENLRRKQREVMNVVTLPFEDMSDEEIAEWARGKRRPRR